MFNQAIKTSKIEFPKKIAVIGGGIAGSMTAFHLAKLGYEVSLIEPRLNDAFETTPMLNATEASLGVLMGYIYRKTSGRSWKLRKRSMELWPKLLIDISKWSNNLKIETPLIQLGTSEKEGALLKKLADKKQGLGIDVLDKETTSHYSKLFNTNIEIALISKNDGRINPKRLLISLLEVLNVYKVEKIAESVVSLERNPNIKNRRWNIHLSNNKILEKDTVVICASLGSKKLLDPLGHSIPLEPILGQVLDLDINIKYTDNFIWPSVINMQGYNFILDNQNKCRMLIGATLENTLSPNENYLNNMKGSIPSNWSDSTLVNNQWYGIRARPTNEASPIIKNLEPGLLINTGHYRNGILLAPACAEWIGQEINEGR